MESPKSDNHAQVSWSRSSTRRPRLHLGNSLPHAPSSQFRTETASFSSVMVINLDLSWADTVKFFSQTSLLAFTPFSTCCLVLQPSRNSRSSALQLVASTCYAPIASLSPLLSPSSARCVWSVLLPAVGNALFCLRVLGSLPCLFSFLGVLGPFPGCFLFLFISFRDVVVTLTLLSELLRFAHSLG